jgi:acylphosphatase
MKRSEPAPAAGALVRAHAHVSGRVQGVGYRYFVVTEAEVLGLEGWVRNLPDGRVELVAQGPRDRVEGLLARCREGPDLSRVGAVDVVWEPAGAELDGFQVRR